MLEQTVDPCHAHVVQGLNPITHHPCGEQRFFGYRNIARPAETTRMVPLPVSSRLRSMVITPEPG